MQKFLSELHANGYFPDQVTLDGKIHRFGRNNSKDNAWLIGWTNHSVTDGSAYIVAEYGDWRTGEKISYKPSGKTLSTADRQAIKAQFEDARKRADEEKKIRNKEAADKAQKYFSSALETGRTNYMDRKKIAELYGARIFNGVLQIPLRDTEGNITGLQYISDTSKRFLTGSKIDGSFHLIGSIENDLIICEGYATGASIHQATGLPVAVAFNAGNLVAVAKALRIKYNDINMIVCGDDDRFTVINGDPVNNGRIKGDKAAMVCHGSAKYPVFSSDEPGEGDSKGPTDFNDLHCREGLERVRSQIIETESEIAVGFIPLGYDDGTFYFYHVPSKDVVRATTFCKAQFYQIAPAEYWEERYPAQKVDFDQSVAMNDLIQMSKKVGPFDSTRIRGTGVWLDEGRIVVNLGHSLVVDGKELALSAIRSWYIYIQTRNRLPPMSIPLSARECKPLIDACLSLKWRDPKAGYLLAGWIFNARISGALPTRSHVWLTGGSGTGKSTVMDRLIEPALGCVKGKIYLQGSSTEAGIRQRMKCSAVPAIFDEFETTGIGSKERVGNLVELLRNTWSETKGSVVKGSANGTSVEYALRFSALVSSIRVNLDNDADRSRFSVLELLPHNNDKEHWTFVKKLLKQISSEFGERLFARSAKMVNTIIRSRDVISDVLAGNINQRYGQQVGMLLAGLWAMMSDDPIDHETAVGLVSELSLIDEKIDADITDEFECFAHLMSHKIMVRLSSGLGPAETREMSIGDCIVSGYADHVIPYGIRVEKERIFIADNHAELHRIFDKTRWISWKMSLRRLPGIEKNALVRIAGMVTRATSIPLSFMREV